MAYTTTPGIGLPLAALTVPEIFNVSTLASAATTRKATDVAPTSTCQSRPPDNGGRLRFSKLPVCDAYESTVKTSPSDGLKLFAGCTLREPSRLISPLTDIAP